MRVTKRGAAVAVVAGTAEFTKVAAANGKAAGYVAPNVLSPELREVVVAQGADRLDGGTAAIPYYGYLGNGPHVPALMASQTDAGVPMKTIDGSTWDPFAQKLLLTNEGGSSGTVCSATADYPSVVHDLSGQLRRGGFDGIQNDDRGNVYVVEDSGGKNGTGANARAKQPNSFVYRFLPKNAADLAQGGTIQALQVIVNGAPLVFGASPDADVDAPGYLALHRYGTSYPTKWVDLATTDAATPLPGPDVNALAKAKGRRDPRRLRQPHVLFEERAGRRRGRR